MSQTTQAPSAIAGLPDPAAPRGFGPAFWSLNTIEMFERLAYFAFRAVAPIYIMQANDPGGLHLTAYHKGEIYAWWAVFQSILPMATGGFADRYGYKRTLVFAFTLMTGGYVMAALLRDVVWLGPTESMTAIARSNYWTLFVSIMVLATGTAFFKPALQGSLAQSLTKENSSVGWGVFYWVVNIGGLIGPFVSQWLLAKPPPDSGMTPEQLADFGKTAWRNLLLAAAGFAAINFVVLFTFKDVPSGADKRGNFFQVFWTTIENIWPYWFRGGRIDQGRFAAGAAVLALAIVMSLWPGVVPRIWSDISPAQLSGGIWTAAIAGILLMTWLRGGVFTWQLRLPTFLLIMSGFWLMMYQLWDLQPNFIVDWVDSSSMARLLMWLPEGMRKLVVEATERGPQVPQQILLNFNALFIILGVIPMAWLTRRMRTLSAMLIGMSVATAGVLVAGWTPNVWILVFGILFFSLGEMLTGPKKNEYLGLIAPPGKKGLYLGYVNIPVGVGVFAGSKIAAYFYGNYGEKATLALKYIATKTPFGEGKSWDGHVDTLEAALGVKRTEAMAKLREVTGLDAVGATDLLWKTYDPHFIWIPFAAVGVVCAIALAIFGQRAKRWADMNA